MGSFGDRLKKEREQRSISLDDISLSTKIGTRLLRALEEEKFEQLPGGIFNKGFVRAYARHLGLDEEQAIADYMAALGESQVKASTEAEAAKPAHAPERPQPVPRQVRDDQPAPEIPWTLLALLLLVIALAFASWNYYHREQRNESVSPNGSSSRLSDAGSAPVNPGSSAQASPAPGSSAANNSIPSSGSGQPTSVAQGLFTVLLKGNESSEESWVSIAVDGNPPVEAMLSAPTQKEIQANKEVVIKAGNVGALDFFFNGKKLPSQGEYGVVKTLTFRSDGLQAPPAKPSTPQAQ